MYSKDLKIQDAPSDNNMGIKESSWDYVAKAIPLIFAQTTVSLTSQELSCWRIPF